MKREKIVRTIKRSNLFIKFVRVLIFLEPNSWMIQVCRNLRKNSDDELCFIIDLGIQCTIAPWYFCSTYKTRCNRFLFLIVWCYWIAVRQNGKMRRTFERYYVLNFIPFMFYTFFTYIILYILSSFPSKQCSSRSHCSTTRLLSLGCVVFP